MSSGEYYIIILLKKAGVKFQKEKKFQDLKHGLFRFDFYLPDYNILIEYDGEQHFHQVKAFQKTRSDFLKAQEHDRRKNSYCLANNIPLYRIPYWELKNLKSLDDIFCEKFLVKTRWHSDNLTNGN